MLNIQFKPEEEMFIDIQQALNVIFESQYPKALEWNHYEMWNFAGRIYAPDDWKQFRLDSRVCSWYNAEMSMLIETRTFKLLAKLGDTKSPADVSALTQMLNQRKEENSGKVVKPTMIYCFIPLNTNERRAPNVRLLESIPSEIQNAIQYLEEPRNE